MENLKKVFERLSELEYTDRFLLCNRKNKGCEKTEELVNLIQLSELPDREKVFFTSFIVELVWREIKLSEKSRHCDVLVIDEFQHIFRHASSSLQKMFCQGRKDHFYLILSTQYLTQYDANDINSFGQNGALFIFKPASEDLEFSSNMIIKRHGDENLKEWIEQLRNLEIGNAAYCGKYTIDEKTTIYNEPVVCKIAHA